MSEYKVRSATVRRAADAAEDARRVREAEAEREALRDAIRMGRLAVYDPAHIPGFVDGVLAELHDLGFRIVKVES